MAWNVDDIKDRLTSFVNNDPEGLYASLTDPEIPVTDPRPNTDPDEWDIIWHYLDRAIYEIVPVSNPSSTIYASSTSSTSTSAPLPVDTWEVQDDPPFKNPVTGEIKVTRQNDYEFSGSVQLTAPGGGSAKASIVFQRSTDDGSSWSDITRTELTVPSISSSSSASLTAPGYVATLNADDRIRLLVEYQSGSGSDVEVTGGWITIKQEN